MGILAFCPRGHRVKVKDELAGRKGICPHCQARFRIPVPGTELPVARVVSLDFALAASLPRAEVIGGGDLMRAAGSPPPDDSEADRRRHDPATTMDAWPDDIPAAAFAPLDNDSEGHDGEDSAPDGPPHRRHPVLAERPDLVWCVAIPGGEPSPPFTAEALERWLEAGLATGEELVWRADWTEWVPLRRVFPGFLPGD